MGHLLDDMLAHVKVVRDGRSRHILIPMTTVTGGVRGEGH